MKGMSCWFVIALQVMSWVSAASRPFPSNGGHDFHQADRGLNPGKSLPGPLEEGLASSINEVSKMKEVENFRGGRKIGSSPPSCENKCYGCTPCEAIQVPTTKRQSHLRVQYANYEPEGWKCKCGPSFYSP